MYGTLHCVMIERPNGARCTIRHHGSLKYIPKIALDNHIPLIRGMLGPPKENAMSQVQSVLNVSVCVVLALISGFWQQHVTLSNFISEET